MKGYLTKKYLILLLLCLGNFLFSQSFYKIQKTKDKNKRQYQFIENDPFNLRIYTLQNGLKVFLSANKKEKEILNFLIQINVGINQIPDSFYLLNDIRCFLDGRYDRGGQEGKIMFHRFYENLLNYDLFDNTKIRFFSDSKDLDKELFSLAESLSNFNSSLFLKTYQEQNLSRKKYKDNTKHTFLRKNLFPTHPYGKKNNDWPLLKTYSSKEIESFFTTYYVVNNMKIIITGDLDYEKTMDKIEEYFQKFPYKKLPDQKIVKEKSICSPIIIKDFDEFSPLVERTYRIENTTSNFINIKVFDVLLGDFLATLTKKNQILEAYNSYTIYEDYILYHIYIKPEKNQTIKKVEGLINKEIQKIKKGKFELNIFKKIYFNYLKKEILYFKKNNYDLASLLSYKNSIEKWLSYLNRKEEIQNLKKEQIMAFAKKNLQNNYIVFYPHNHNRDKEEIFRFEFFPQKSSSFLDINNNLDK